MWDRFVENCPHALLFHTSEWLVMLTAIYPMCWHPTGIWMDEQLIGLFPLFVRKLGPFHLAGSPLMQAIASTPYLGPLIPAGLIPATLSILDERLKAWHIDHIEIAFPVQLENPSALQKLGYSMETCHYVSLALDRPSEEIWKNFSAACRRAIRKAEASQVEIAEVSKSEFLEEYMGMCREVYRGSGRRPHLSLNFYQRAWEYMSRKGNIKIVLAAQGNQILAGGIFLLFRNTAYYLSGASYNSSLPLRPNNLIQWYFIQWARDHGYETYEMGGAVIPGITRFKLSFGGELHSYTRLYRANSPVANYARSAYIKLIPFWRKINLTFSIREKIP